MFEDHSVECNLYIIFRAELSQVIRHLLAYKTCLYSLDQKLKKMDRFGH